MSVLICDTECYHGYWYVSFKRVSDGYRARFELSKRSPNPDRERVREIMESNIVVGYNFAGYDAPMIYLFLDGANNAELKAASDQIIKKSIKWWNVEREIGVKISRKANFIDLMEPQPNAFAKLKILIGRMHGKRLQDLPFEPDHRPTDAQKDKINEYCDLGDIDGTELLWHTLREPMELRVTMGREYDEDFRSKSDSQMGEAIIKKRFEQLTGRMPKKPDQEKARQDFYYEVPDFISFKTPQLRNMLARLREQVFKVKKDGKVALPKWLENEEIVIGNMVYQMGLGGLHSTEENRAVHSDEEYALIDADVASQYPAIELKLGLYPPSLGKVFLRVYRDMMNIRLDAKKHNKDITERLKRLNKAIDAGPDDVAHLVEDIIHEIEAELDALADSRINDPDVLAQKAAKLKTSKLDKELKHWKALDKGFKIALNGGYFGKTSSQYSVLFAPHITIHITLTGQLTLLMLIERAEAAGIQVVSGNTDGVLFKCPRHLWGGMAKDAAGKDTDRLAPSPLADICDWWEEQTSFKLEFAEYKSVYSASVNTYYAIKANGGHKRIGMYRNPWNKHPDDFDPVRGQLMKNPNMTICSDAALNLIKDGTPIEDTIYGCTDFTQFVTLQAANSGATWRGKRLGTVVRYYWCTDGDIIQGAEPHETTGNYRKIPNTSGCAPCMNLPDEMPDDIDYDRYIRETIDRLTELGYYQKKKPFKMERLTKANTELNLLMWGLVG